MIAPRVKFAFDRVYKEEGFVPTSKVSKDPWSRSVLEREARKRALACMSSKDRILIEGCAERLKDCCRETQLGDTAAMQILAHLGVFLLEAEGVR